jgi:hypothetical protein
MQRITINRPFYFENKMYRKGEIFIVNKPFNACPEFITVEELKQPSQSKKRKRAKTRNVAILNKDR